MVEGGDGPVVHQGGGGNEEVEIGHAASEGLLAGFEAGEAEPDVCGAGDGFEPVLEEVAVFFPACRALFEFDAKFDFGEGDDGDSAGGVSGIAPAGQCGEDGFAAEGLGIDGGVEKVGHPGCLVEGRGGFVAAEGGEVREVVCFVRVLGGPAFPGGEDVGIFLRGIWGQGGNHDQGFAAFFDHEGLAGAADLIAELGKMCFGIKNADGVIQVHGVILPTGWLVVNLDVGWDIALTMEGIWL